MSRSLVFLFAVATLVAVSGCRVAVIVLEGGEVQAGTDHTCGSGEICFYDAADTTFPSYFSAVPDPGWVFLHWQRGEDFLCQGGEYSCGPFNFDWNSELAASFLESNRVFRLSPVFRRKAAPGETLGTPIDSVVTVNARQWAQPFLFKGVSYADIESVCPQGECDGALGGYDVTGWKWADRAAINQLFNHYIGREALGADVYDVSEEPAFWILDFWKDEWNYLFESGIYTTRATQGYYYSPDGSDFNTARMREGSRMYVRSEAKTDLNLPAATFTYDWVGAWLYRVD